MKQEKKNQHDKDTLHGCAADGATLASSSKDFCSFKGAFLAACFLPASDMLSSSSERPASGSSSSKSEDKNKQTLRLLLLIKCVSTVLFPLKKGTEKAAVS